MWKAEPLKIRLFGLFGPQSGLFRQKEEQFRSIFSKRSPIRPRSDKADLLGSTPRCTLHYCPGVLCTTVQLYCALPAVPPLLATHWPLPSPRPQFSWHATLTPPAPECSVKCEQCSVKCEQYSFMCEQYSVMCEQ